MEYTGEIMGFPREVVEKMMDRQEEQGNPRNAAVFSSSKTESSYLGRGGFNWSDTVEDHDFWSSVIENANFKLFFEKYPKQSEFPKVMYTWTHQKSRKKPRVVFMVKNENYYTWGHCDNIEDSEQISTVFMFKNAEEILS